MYYLVHPLKKTTKTSNLWSRWHPILKYWHKRLIYKGEVMWGFVLERFCCISTWRKLLKTSRKLWHQRQTYNWVQRKPREPSFHSGTTKLVVCTWCWLLEGSIWLMVLPVGTQLPPKLGGGFFVSWPAAAHVWTQGNKISNDDTLVSLSTVSWNPECMEMRLHSCKTHLQYHCYMKVSESEYQSGLTKDKRVKLATRNFQGK